MSTFDVQDGAPPHTQRRHKPTLRLTFNGSKAVFTEVTEQNLSWETSIKNHENRKLFIVRSDLGSLFERVSDVSP